MTEPIATAEPYAEALVTAEALAQDAISDNLVAIMLTLWASFVAESAFYSGEAVAEFGRRVATYVIAAQRQAGLIAEAHLREQVIGMGLTVPPSSVLDLPADLRLGAATDDVYQRPIRQVRYLESTGVPLAEAVQTATERLEKTALTDLQLARSTAAQQVMYSLPDDTPAGPVRGYRRVIHPELGAVCGLCIAAADRIYQKRDLLPLHPGCVVEGTEVSADGVRALTRRRYSGRLVVLRTGTGEKLTVTPNHPVLTDQGWVRADRLQVGDRVVRSGGSQGAGRRRPDQQQSPTRVEDLWRAATVLGGLLPRSVPLAPEDLHGDGGDGEVEVVLVDRHLANIGDVSFVQPGGEHGLVDAHGRRIGLSRSGVLAPVLDRLLLPANGLVRGGGDPLALPGTVPVPQESSLGLRADRNFSAPETPDDGGAGYAEVGRELLDRLAGQVEFSDLVEVDITTGSCHVYNLETREGWYTGSSLVVSNCKCTTIPVIGVQDPGGTLNSEDLGRIYDAAGGSTAAEKLRQTRFSVKENGELGPVLVSLGENRTTAEQAVDRLSDRAKQMRREQLARQIEELRPRAARSQWHADRLEQLQELLDAA